MEQHMGNNKSSIKSKSIGEKKKRKEKDKVFYPRKGIHHQEVKQADRHSLQVGIL